MTEGLALSLISQTIYITLLLSLPLLGVGMLVGLVISIFQATTSIQEQTLTFVPKLVVVFILLVVAGPFFLNTLTDFTKRLFDMMVRIKM